MTHHGFLFTDRRLSGAAAARRLKLRPRRSGCSAESVKSSPTLRLLESVCRHDVAWQAAR
jgi:hypothetical protein